MACHFLEDKKISISLRRRFQFWLLSVLSVFAKALHGRRHGCTTAAGRRCAGNTARAASRQRARCCTHNNNHFLISKLLN
jgi:hypothetical protein